MSTTHRHVYAELVEIAAEQHGFLRSQDVIDRGINPSYLRQLVQKGTLERVSYGLYRVNAIPRTAHDEFHRAVLLGGANSFIIGESAILLLELADVNPRVIDVGVPRQVRRKEFENVHFRIRNNKQEQLEVIDNIPVLSPYTAIGDMISAGVEGGLVEQAIRTARGRNMIGEVAEARLRVKLADRSSKRTD